MKKTAHSVRLLPWVLGLFFFVAFLGTPACGEIESILKKKYTKTQERTCENPIELKSSRSYPKSQDSSVIDIGTTFGIPLPPGCIPTKSRFTLNIKSESANRPLEIDILQQWKSTDYGFQSDQPESIRWLKVSTVVPVMQTKIPIIELHHKSSQKEHENNIGTDDDMSAIIEEIKMLGIGTNFRIKYGRKSYPCKINSASKSSGSVLSTYKLTGIYTKPLYDSPINSIMKSLLQNPQDTIARCEITIKNYENTPIVKIYHTFTWLKEGTNKKKFVSLDYTINDVDEATIKIDRDEPRDLEIGSSFTQVGRLRNVKPPEGISPPVWEWVKYKQKKKKDSKIVSVRWSDENYPNKVTLTQSGDKNDLVIGLLTPLSVDSIRNPAVGSIRNFDYPFVPGPEIGTAGIPFDSPSATPPNLEGKKKIPYNKENIMGMSKTHEISISTLGNASEGEMYQFSERPLIYQAKSELMSASLQPVPWVPTNSDAGSLFDTAIDLSIRMMQQRTESIRASELGWLYHGATHSDLNTAAEETEFRADNRYWNNHNGLTGNLAWLQWMRTGDENHLEFAEVNSRYLMDLATYNGDTRVFDQTNINGVVGFQGGHFITGSQYPFAQTPWGLHTYGFGGFHSEVDYLLSYCYLLGYDRACQHLERRQLQWCNFDPLERGAQKVRGHFTRLQELLFNLRDPLVKTSPPVFCTKGYSFAELMSVKADEIIELYRNVPLTDEVYDDDYGAALMEAKLAMAADYSADKREKIQDILEMSLRYYGFYGDAGRKSHRTIQSIWPLLARSGRLEEIIRTDEAKELLQKAKSMAFGHSLLVGDDSVPKRWQGRSINSFRDLAGDVREWIALQWRLENQKLYPPGEDITLEPTPAALFMSHPSGGERTHQAFTRCLSGSENPDITVYFGLKPNPTDSSVKMFDVTGVEDPLIDVSTPVDNDLSQQQPKQSLALFQRQAQEWPPDQWRANYKISGTCVENQDYRIDVNIKTFQGTDAQGNLLFNNAGEPIMWPVGTVYAITTSTGKLIHFLPNNLVRTASSQLGGTVWMKIWDETNERAQIPFRFGVREVNNTGGCGGKQAAFHFAESDSGTTNCRAEIVERTDSSKSGCRVRETVVSDCAGGAPHDSLIGMTTIFSESDTNQMGSLVLMKDKNTNKNTIFPNLVTVLGRCVSITQSEYFDLEERDVCHPPLSD